jgi:hypothetical protein
LRGELGLISGGMLWGVGVLYRVCVEWMGEMLYMTFGGMEGMETIEDGDGFIVQDDERIQCIQRIMGTSNARSNV